MSTARTWQIVVSPEIRDDKRYSARFTAYLDGQLLGAWRTPLLSAARHLLENYGADPGHEITMRHASSPTISMRCSVGQAAGLTVQEGEKTGPRFRPYDASLALRFKAPAADQGSAGPTTHADTNGRPCSHAAELLSEAAP